MELTAIDELDTTAASIESRHPGDLNPHELNTVLYGDESDIALETSIKLNGILTPLLITADNMIISGHRRHRIALKLGMDSVPVIVSTLSDETEIEEALIRANIHRTKTVYQKLREYQRLKPIETELARRRMLAGVAIPDIVREMAESATPGINPSPGSTTGKAREITAKMLGMSGTQAELGVKVLDAITLCEGQGEDEAADAIRKALEKSIAGGHTCAVERGFIDKNPDTSLNKSNPSIDWSGFSWNPVTGCDNNCQYCYARDIATRFSRKYLAGKTVAAWEAEKGLRQPPEANLNPFAPRIHERRFSAVARQKPPKPDADIKARCIFVCSMADLFGPTIPQEWIERVREVAIDSQQQGRGWIFIFLTKFPDRIVEFDWPANCWIGTTVDGQGRVAKAMDAFARLKARSPETVTFISGEPFTAPLEFPSLTMFDWVIIGARSKTTKLAEAQPDLAATLSLIAQAKRDGCRVYCKPNLKPTWPKEFPTDDANTGEFADAIRKAAELFQD